MFQKVVTLIVVASVATTSAFVVNTPSSRVSTSAVFAETSTTRASFLGQIATSLIGASTILSQPVYAASYGGLGIAPTATLDPKDAEYDTDIMKSKSVQGAISKIKQYQSVVQSMKQTLQNDKQSNIKSTILKELDFAALRETLNVYNTAFEEDTQRSTDRLIRVIIQDITELEIANRQKDNIPRSDRRVDTMNGKLDKLDQAFLDILAYAK